MYFTKIKRKKQKPSKNLCYSKILKLYCIHQRNGQHTRRQPLASGHISNEPYKNFSKNYPKGNRIIFLFSKIWVLYTILTYNYTCVLSIQTDYCYAQFEGHLQTMLTYYFKWFKLSISLKSFIIYLDMFDSYVD